MAEVKFIGKVKLTKQGQITLPMEGRKDLHISVGDELYWYELAGSLVLVNELQREDELEKKIKKR